MPIFEYKCADCGRVEEFLEKANSRRKRTCPDCGSTKMEKLFSAFAVGVSEQGQSSKCQTCTDGSCPHSQGI